MCGIREVEVVGVGGESAGAEEEEDGGAGAVGVFLINAVINVCVEIAVSTASYKCRN